MAIFFLPGRPETTDFLTEEERELALARANRDTSGDIGYHLNKRTVNVFVGRGAWAHAVTRTPLRY